MSRAVKGTFVLLYGEEQRAKRWRDYAFARDSKDFSPLWRASRSVGNRVRAIDRKYRAEPTL